MSLFNMEGYYTAMAEAAKWYYAAKWYQRQLAAPAPGWYTFGSHIDSDVELEFWGHDEEGLPLWERPVDVRNDD
jgi:hypothetical protein